MEISYDKNREGAWILSTTLGGRHYARLYYFYTKREATRMFKEFIKGEN